MIFFISICVKLFFNILRYFLPIRRCSVYGEFYFHSKWEALVHVGSKNTYFIVFSVTALATGKFQRAGVDR